MGLRSSAGGRQGSELSAWLPGAVFTGLHTGDRTGAGPWRPLLRLLAGGAGAPHQHQSPGQAQGECQRGGDPTPRRPQSRPAPPLGPSWRPAPKGIWAPISSPTRPHGPGPALSRCKVTIHIYVGISERDFHRIPLHLKKKIIYFWLRWVFVAACRLSLVAASRGYSSLQCLEALESRLSSWWRTGLVAPRHVGSSRTRARTRAPCIGRRILSHCTTREAPT